MSSHQRTPQCPALTARLSSPAGRHDAPRPRGLAPGPRARPARTRAISLGAAALCIAGLAAAPAPAAADTCQRYLTPQQTVAGYRVGEMSCQISSGADFTDARGSTWHELDLAISGTAAGYTDTATATANFRRDLTDTPDLLFPQFGITQWAPASASYSGGSGTAGAGISVLYPADAAAWNGDAVLLMHGQADDVPLGTMVPQQPGEPLPADTFNNLFADEWVDAGYAVIYVRRPAASGVTATTRAGQQIPSSLNDNVRVGLDFLASGQKVIAHQLGRAPARTLAYGHSSGTIWGLLADESGLDTRPGGAHIISGFLFDDPGGGFILPLQMPQGQILGERGPLATYPPGSYLPQALRRQMAPGLVLAHADYLATHTWLPGVTYLTLKQQAQQLYQAEGLTGTMRTYVIAGVSHIPASTGSPPGTLDYGPLIQALIPMLAGWVAGGTPPPPSIAAPPGNTNPALQLRLPPIACPMGVRYPWPYPSGGPTATGFVPFGDGTTLEPVNSQGALVDVDHNGYRDPLPSLDAAWRALHLIAPGQHVTRAVYVHCVTDAATALQRRGLLTPAGVAQYSAAATRFPDVD